MNGYVIVEPRAAVAQDRMLCGAASVLVRDAQSLLGNGLERDQGLLIAADDNPY